MIPVTFGTKERMAGVEIPQCGPLDKGDSEIKI